MKRYLLFTVASCFCGLAFAQGADGDATKPVGPKLWIESKAIDIGVIAVGQQEIKDIIPYMNDGDETTGQFLREFN